MKILRLKQVLELVGVSRATLWRWEKREIFPKRVRISERSIGYVDTEVNEWISRRPRGPGQRVAPGRKAAGAKQVAATRPVIELEQK